MAYIINPNYTLSEVINLLKKEGYSTDFNLPNSCVEFRDDPGQFVIENTFRFDVQSDPDDQSVLYAIHCKRLNIKGILLNSYGLYHEPETSKILLDIQTDYSNEKGTEMSDKFEQHLDDAPTASSRN